MGKTLKSKKIIALMLIMGISIIGIICVGCSKKSDTKKSKISKEEQVKIELIKKAKGVIKAFVDNNYDKTKEYHSESIKAQFTKETFDNIRTEVIKHKYKTVKDTYYYKQIGQDSTDVHYVRLYVENDKSNSVIDVMFGGKDRNVMSIYFPDYLPDLVNDETQTESYVTFGKEKLDGVLTLPANVTNTPVVLLVNGSGQLDADSTIYQNKPFKEIAHGLAKKGIASLRYCERYYRNPYVDGKGEATVTIYDEIIDDACDAIKYLSTESRINKEKIFLLGHSLAGNVAPNIAAKCSEVKGIVSMAGSPRHFADISADQQINYINLSEEYTQEQKQEYINKVNEIKEKAKSINVNGADIVGDLNKTYWNSLNSLKTVETIQSIQIPMLIMQGKADVQVYADKDYVEWQNVLQNRTNVTFKLYDELNHAFVKTNGCNILQMQDEYAVPKSVEQYVIDDIGTFIMGN